MPYRSGIFRFVGLLFLIMSLVAMAFADTIRLKDGSILKGKIVSFDNGKFVVAIGDGSRRRQLSFMSSEIASIEFDSPTGPPQLPSSADRTTSYQEPVTNVSPRVIVSDNTVRTNKQPSSNNGNIVRTNTPPPPRNPGSGEKMKPIEWQIKVLADNTSNGWTNSGWVVKKGQRIRITGDGQISLGKGQSSPPSGIASLNDDKKLLKSVATGALIAVIGDDNNDFIYVGAEREFTAARDGALFLGINEGNLNDNSGSYNVKVEILPNDGN